MHNRIVEERESRPNQTFPRKPSIEPVCSGRAKTQDFVVVVAFISAAMLNFRPKPGAGVLKPVRFHVADNLSVPTLNANKTLSQIAVSYLTTTPFGNVAVKLVKRPGVKKALAFVVKFCVASMIHRLTL